MRGALIALMASTSLANAALVSVSGPDGGSISGDLMTGNIPAPGYHWLGSPPHPPPGATFDGFLGFGGWFDLPSGRLIPGPPGSINQPGVYETGASEDTMIGYVYKFPPTQFRAGGDLVLGLAQPDSFPAEPFDPFVGPIQFMVPVTIGEEELTIETIELTGTAFELGFAVMKWWKLEGNLPDVILTSISFGAAAYAPVTRTTYNGIVNMINGIISAGITSMDAGSVPIGPDPTAAFDIPFGATEFTGTFDYVGSPADPIAIHNITLFVDGIPVTPSVPEPSTWIMMLAGFAVLRRARSGLAGLPTSRARSSPSFSA